MHPIKFRVWHKDTSKMEYPSTMDVLNPLVITLDGELLQLVDEDMVKQMAKPAEIVLPDEVEVMQFTGLLDKNGKEIYEGDIIVLEDERMFGGTNERYRIGRFDHNAEVVFEGSSFGVSIKDDSCNFKKGFISFENIFGCTSQSEFDVIGNIYENSDLSK